MDERKPLIISLLILISFDGMIAIAGYIHGNMHIENVIKYWIENH